MKRDIRNLVKGILVLLLGAWVLGAALGFWSLQLFDGWWTLFIIIPGVLDMISYGVKWGNSIIVSIGACLLLSEFGVLDDVNIVMLLLGIALVSYGLKTVFKKKNLRDNDKEI